MPQHAGIERPPGGNLVGITTVKVDMLRGRRIEAAWTALLLLVAVLGLLTSEGEPVCEGPLIFRVDDSLPPHCPSPVEFLPAVGIAWVVGLGVILGIRALVRSTSPD
jgi:hypothetical protein